MLLQQYYLECLAHASYLIADEVTGTAVVVDPQRDIGQYLADAEAHRLHIRHVFLTHFHADFLAGHLELHAHTSGCHRAQRRLECLPVSRTCPAHRLSREGAARVGHDHDTRNQVCQEW